jgi:hypothetical protein
MNAKRLRVGLCLALMLCAAKAHGQYLFYVTFRGMSYQTNTAGNIVATPITEQTWLQQAAAAGGVDPSTLAVVYHVNGNSSFGDTMEVVNSYYGTTYTTLFGLYFGDYDGGQNLGRTALTNAPYTEVRRVDYIYNTQQSQFALGGSFTTKRFVHNPSGLLSLKVDGELEYLVRPQGTNPAQICAGTFTTTKPFVQH